MYFRYLINPARAPRWFGLFLLAYAANYVWQLLLNINFLKLSWVVLHPPPDGWHSILNIELFYYNFIYTILETVFLPIVLFPLLRQKRWGWILAVGGIVVFLTTRLAQLDISLRSPASIGYDWFQVIVPIAINAAFVTYLLRNETIRFFGVRSRTRKYTILVSVTVALLFAVTGRIIYRI